MKNNVLHINQTKEFNTIVKAAHTKGQTFSETYATRFERNSLLRHMLKLKRSTLLDIGCGTGRFVIPMAKIAKHVTGIDLSSVSINVLKAQAKKERLSNITALVQSYVKLPNIKKYDYVLIVNLLHHVQNLEILLKKIQRVIRDDGTLIIFEFNPLNLLYIPFMLVHNQLWVHLNKEYIRSNKWVIAGILQSSGYSIQSIQRYAFLPTVLYNISPHFVRLNNLLNSIPVLNQFCAFHIITCKISKNVKL